MTTESLIAEFQALGVELIPDPERDKIRIRPAGVVPADLKERLRARKAEVLAALAGPRPNQQPLEPAPLATWPAALPGLGPRRVIAFSPCSDCAIDPPEDDVLKVGMYEIAVPGPRGTFVSYADMPVCRRHARRRAEVDR